MADAGTRSLNLPAGELRWLALVWLLVGLLLAGVLWLVKGQVEEREGALLAQQARMLSSLLAQQMVTLDGMLAVLADAPEHTREEAATGSGWLLRQVQAQARLAGGIVAVLDGQGVVLAASDGALIGTRHDGEPFFEPLRRAPSAQTLYLGPPHRQGLMGDALVLSRAIVSPRAQLLGVVSAAFDLSLLKRSFAEVRMAPDAVAQLIYGEQAMLIPLGDDSAGAALDPTAQGLALMRHRALGVPASVQQVAVHGQSPELLAAVQSLGLPGVVTDRPLTLSVARSTRAIMDNWLALARALGLLYLFSTMAALGGLLWVRRRRRRRQAQRQHERQELHNLQARWNAVLHATHIGIWDWDQRTRRVYYSPAVQTMLGYGEHEFGTSWHAWASLLHPDDRGGLLGRLREFLRQREEVFFENVHRMRRKDGSYQWVEVRGRVVERDDAGRPLRVAGVQSDISQRRELETRLERLSAGVPGALFEYRRDPNGRDSFPFCTDKISELLELTPAQLRQSAGHLLKRVHPQDVAPLLRSLLVSVQNLTPWRHSYRVLLPSGEERWISGMSQPRRADGGATLWSGYLWDTTQEHALRERLDMLVENVPGLLYQSRLEPDGRKYFAYASKGAIALYGVTPEQMCSDAQSVFARFERADFDSGMQKLAASARDLTLWSHDYRVNLPGQPQRWVRAQARPQRLPGGAVQWHGYAQDVTEARAQASRLQEAQQLLDHLMREMPVALCMVDQDGLFYYRNRAFEQYFGYGPEEVITRERWWHEVYPDEDYRAQMWRQWNDAKANAPQHGGRILPGDARMWTRSSGQRIMSVSGMAFGEHYLLAFVDQTEQHARSEMLREMAYIDALTGVANRRQLDLTLKAEWGRCRRSGQPLALLMIDIDLFKAFNDLYGHQEGDECLAAVAGALRAGLSRAHDLVGRYGGEEFLCVLPMCDLDGGLRKAETLRQAVQDLAVVHEGSNVAGVVTVSVGVAAQLPDELGDAQQLVAQADRALYLAKQQGRNRVAGG